MPPRKDSNGEKSISNGGTNITTSTISTTPTTNTTTTTTTISTANNATTTLLTTTTTTLPTIPTTTTTTTTTAASTATITIPHASVTNTRSASTALAAAAAACVLNADGSAVATTNPTTNPTTNSTTIAAEITKVIVAETGGEQRTMAFQANAKLCRLVRKCPWMYDRNHHNYAKKHILDKSWVKIARECNDTVPSCKERWRNIRAAFARSINIYKTHSGPNRVKPYYLHKELSFLVKPMMEGRDKNDDTQDNLEGVSKYELTEGEDDDEDHDINEDPQVNGDEDEFIDETTSDAKSTFEAPNAETNNQAEAKLQKMLKNLNNVLINNSRPQTLGNNDFENNSPNLFDNQADFSVSDAENDFHYTEDTMSQMEVDRKSVNMLNHIGGIKRPLNIEAEGFEAKRLKLAHIAPSAVEADIRFLEALLPDMALMNTRQKIIFKRKIYQTLEEVFENVTDFPNLSTHNEQQQNNVTQTMITTTTNNQQQQNMPPNHNHNTTPLGNNQVKQTVLTVNSSTARNLINNIANLSETDLQRVHGFLQSNMRATANNTGGCNIVNTSTNNNNISNNNLSNMNQNSTQRLTNGSPMPPSSAAAVRLMHSTPKITITKVTCPPPASLRNINMNKPPSPTTATVSTTIHHSPGPIMTSNVHSTTSTMAANTSIGSNSVAATNSNANPWSQLIPIAIKDEIEDVDID